MADAPLINGHRYSYGSIEIGLDGPPSLEAGDIVSIDYGNKGDFALVRGSGARVKGDTVGEMDHEGSLEILKSAAHRLKQKWGDGWMRKRFPIVVNYREDGEDGGMVTDELIGVRVKSTSQSHKVGTDALTEKWDLHIMRLKEGGIDPFGDR